MQQSGVIEPRVSDPAWAFPLPYRAGLIPERTTDPRRAFHLWSSDGAVILSTARIDAAGMLAGAQDVFGPRILFYRSSATVTTDTMPGHETCDGQVTFGHHYPDLVFLQYERQAAEGGESFVVDGQRLVYAIASDPTQRTLSRFLWDIKLEQSRPDGAGPAGTGRAAPSRRPVASRTCAGRLTVRHHRHQRLLDDGAARPEDRRHLATWARLTGEAARTAPRFLLQPGDLLCLDNYRVFHGREPYAGFDRNLHKLWAWSDMAFGLPSAADLVCGGVGRTTEPTR